MLLKCSFNYIKHYKLILNDLFIGKILTGIHPWDKIETPDDFMRLLGENLNPNYHVDISAIVSLGGTQVKGLEGILKLFKRHESRDLKLLIGLNSGFDETYPDFGTKYKLVGNFQDYIQAVWKMFTLGKRLHEGDYTVQLSKHGEYGFAISSITIGDEVFSEPANPKLRGK